MNDAVMVEFFNSHYYKVTTPAGLIRYIPSVTTKLRIVDKPFLRRWRGDLGNSEADLRLYDAGGRGKCIHWAYATMLKAADVGSDPWQSTVYMEPDLAALPKE